MRIFGLVSLLIVVAIIGLWVVKSLTSSSKSENAPLQTEAIAKAKALYIQQKSAGIDFSDGPCLSNDLLPAWVADIVHEPRQSADDLPQNQCSAYLEGKAQHFVELDVTGELIQAK